MAESYNTLDGLVQLNDKNLADLNVSDLLDEAPLLKVMFAQAASNGTEHKYLKQTTASSAGFRAANAGIIKTASADTLVTDTLKILDASFDTDVALALAYKSGVDAWLQLETIRSLKQSFSVVEKQVINGVNTTPGGLADGFIGLGDATQLASIGTMCVACATPGAGANVQTSVYFIRDGRDDVSFIMGNDGKIVVEEEPTIIQKIPSSSYMTTVYPAYYVPVLGYCGFQIGGAYSAARVCNIQTVLTDDDLYAGLALFPSSRPATKVIMNRTALKFLRVSRTAVNPTGAPAPFPSEIGGIPIIVTDSVSCTEAVLT